MKNNYSKYLLTLIVIAFVVPSIALAAWWNPFSWGIWKKINYFFRPSIVQQIKPVVCTQEAKLCPDGSYVSRTGPNCEFAQCPGSEKDNYSFNVVEKLDPDEQYPNESVEIYRNQVLIKTIDIRNTYIKPSLFALSPDQKYVAFKVAIYGGTCVYKASPMIIDLSDFSTVTLDDSDINRKINAALGIDISKVIKFSTTQDIKDIRWVSNNKIEATMQFGDDTGCSIIYFNKPADSPVEINTEVDFTIIPSADQTAGWKTYTDDKYGFQVNYPKEYIVNQTFAGDGVSVIGFNIKKADNNKKIAGAWATMYTSDTSEFDAFKDFAEEHMLGSCVADGLDVSVYCDKVTQSTSFLNKNGVKIYEIYLNEITANYKTNTKTDSIVGPFFAIEFPQKISSSRGIYFNITVSNADSEGLLKKILSTFKFTPVK